jgi:serine/threonine protein phosphatase 1
MRTLAIGDIHGCSKAFDALLTLVAPAPQDRLIALGDYVDRGPDSRGVLDRLIELFDKNQFIPLRGNHDFLMTQARRGLDLDMWMGFGGKETLASYGISDGDSINLSKVPARHWKFLEKDCRDWFETETHFFVHAYADPTLPLKDQPTYLLHWEKLIDRVEHHSGKIMVCGHTKQKSGRPLNLETTVCIDTGVYEPTGWLTCLEIETGHFWQANQAGLGREGHIGEPVD